MPQSEIELSKTGIWPEDAVHALGEHWLVSVQQIVALAAMPNGVKQISTIASLDLDTVSSLLTRTRALLSPAELRELDTPVDIRGQSLGALHPGDDA